VELAELGELSEPAAPAALAASGLGLEVMWLTVGSALPTHHPPEVGASRLQKGPFCRERLHASKHADIHRLKLNQMPFKEMEMV
jgi:hypothetical protein